MILHQGYSAIDFATTDIHGNEIKLSDYKGKKIYLSFMRNVGCPFCNVRVHKMMANSVRLDKSGIKVILFFESTAEKLRSSVLHEGLSPWPLVGDPAKLIYNQYGVEKSVMGAMRTMIATNVIGKMREASKLDVPKGREAHVTDSLMPADFFIDESFEIVKAHYGKHMDDHVTIDEIKKFAGIQF